MSKAVELYPGVVADPKILGGKPVIKDTRVPVALVGVGANQGVQLLQE